MNCPRCRNLFEEISIGSIRAISRDELCIDCNKVEAINFFFFNRIEYFALVFVLDSPSVSNPFSIHFCFRLHTDYYLQERINYGNDKN